MADLVFKKYRDDAGWGVAPKNLTAFKVAAKDGCAALSWTAEDTIIDSQLIVRVKGLMIRRSTEGYPAGPYDGELVIDTTELSGSYTDEGLVNDTTYYYTALPYSDHNVFNLKGATAECTPKAYWLYGFHHNFSNTNPDSCITYLSDCQNANFAKAHHNKDSGTVTDGSWGEWSWLQQNLPYMVKTDGTVDYALNPNDYTKKADGTASDVANNSYNGGAFAWLPKLYMKEVYASDGNSRDVYFSDVQLDDGFEAIGFIDGDGNELEGLWLPMFYCASNGKSISGQQPAASLTCDGEKALLDKISSRARFLGGPILNVIRDIEYMMYKSTDIQTHQGQGRMNGYVNSSPYYGVVANAVVSGGRFYGTNANNLNKAFHSIILPSYQQLLRDPYWLTISGQTYVSPYYNYSLSGSGYTKPGLAVASNSAWTYAKKLVNIPHFGSIPDPASKDATSSTGLCDGQYYNASGTRVALRLGCCYSGLVDGPACVNLGNEASNANWNCGLGCVLLPSAGYAPA